MVGAALLVVSATGNVEIELDRVEALVAMADHPTVTRPVSAATNVMVVSTSLMLVTTVASAIVSASVAIGGTGVVDVDEIERGDAADGEIGSDAAVAAAVTSLSEATGQLVMEESLTQVLSEPQPLPHPCQESWL